MPENVVSTKLKLTTEGASDAVRDMGALNDQAARTAASFQEAEAASKGLNASIADTPAMQANFWDSGAQAKIQDDIKKTSKVLESAGESAYELGAAGEQLSEVLDSVIPGLGGIVESLMSMNPVAIAGTVALTGIVLVFGELQRQAEAAKKAAEALVKAEQDRYLAKIDLEQLTLAAENGSAEARNKIISDLIDATAAMRDTQVLIGKNVSDQAARKAEIEELNAKILAASEQGLTEAVHNLVRRRTESQNTLAALEKEAATLNTQWSNNNTTLINLNDAAKKVNITLEEQAAVQRAVFEGAEGANAALEEMANKTEEGSSKLTDLAKSAVDALAQLGQDAKNAVKNIAENIAKDRAEAEERLLDVNQKLTAVESDRGKLLADRVIEDSRAAEFAKLETRLANAQANDAAQQRNKKLADIQQQGQAAEIAAQQKFIENQQKLLGSYLKAEQNATEDYSRERVRKLEDLYNTLNDLASQRDVAGFVRAQRSGMLDINRGDEDAGVAAQRRREQYDQQAADLNAAFAKETAARQDQLNQRLQQEMQAGQQEITATSRAQKAIADLRAQYAAQDLRARRMQEDATYRQTVDILQKKRMDELKITAGAAAGVIDIVSKMKDAITKFGSGLGQAAARGLPKFDTGTPYITKTGLAIVHEGERIMTAAENARILRGGSTGGSPNLIIQNLNVGKIASPDDIAAVRNEIVGALESYAGNSNN